MCLLGDRQPLHQGLLNSLVLRGWKFYTQTWPCPDFEWLLPFLQELTSFLNPLAQGGHAGYPALTISVCLMTGDAWLVLVQETLSPG